MLALSASTIASIAAFLLAFFFLPFVGQMLLLIATVISIAAAILVWLLPWNKVQSLFVLGKSQRAVLRALKDAFPEGLPQKTKGFYDAIIVQRDAIDSLHFLAASIYCVIRGTNPKQFEVVRSALLQKDSSDTDYEEYYLPCLKFVFKANALVYHEILAANDHVTRSNDTRLDLLVKEFPKISAPADSDEFSAARVELMNALKISSEDTLDFLESSLAHMTAFIALSRLASKMRSLPAAFYGATINALAAGLTNFLNSLLDDPKTVQELGSNPSASNAVIMFSVMSSRPNSMKFLWRNFGQIDRMALNGLSMPVKINFKHYTNTMGLVQDLQQKYRNQGVSLNGFNPVQLVDLILTLYYVRDGANTEINSYIEIIKGVNGGSVTLEQISSAQFNSLSKQYKFFSENKEKILNDFNSDSVSLEISRVNQLFKQLHTEKLPPEIRSEVEKLFIVMLRVTGFEPLEKWLNTANGRSMISSFLGVMGGLNVLREGLAGIQDHLSKFQGTAASELRRGIATLFNPSFLEADFSVSSDSSSNSGYGPR